MKIDYYRKYLDVVSAIGNKKSKFPETTNNLEDLESKKEDIQIRYRIDGGKKWREIPAVLDSTSKMIESNDFKIDLHRAFVSSAKDEYDRK